MSILQSHAVTFDYWLITSFNTRNRCLECGGMHVMTPDQADKLAKLLAPVRRQIDIGLAAYDPSLEWEDHRASLWNFVPDELYQQVWHVVHVSLAEVRTPAGAKSTQPLRSLDADKINEAVVDWHLS